MELMHKIEDSLRGTSVCAGYFMRSCRAVFVAVLILLSIGGFGQRPGIEEVQVSSLTGTGIAMQMPGRNYSSTNYRYGFNGKESDNDVSGGGNQYDYGFRIYNPRLGRFLSVDPLTNKYPELTPYQFASNSPIDGVDLDGLEYVSSEKVRIEARNGEVRLKKENLTSVTKNLLEAANNNTKNWKPGEIGIDLTVAKFGFIRITPKESTDVDPADGNPTQQAGKLKVVNPVANSTKQTDQRYKERTINAASPQGSKGLAIAQLIVGGVTWAVNKYMGYHIDTDRDLINAHMNSFKLATADVNYALKSTGLIPPDLRTNEYLSDIINVVLTGESLLNADDKNRSKVIEVGKEIFSNYSVKRGQYTGKVITKTTLDGITVRINEPNIKRV